MTTDTAAPSYKGVRFPQEFIAHAVWLYHRFNLSFRDVEELLAARGVHVTYETVRQSCKRFGQRFANHCRRRRAQPGDKWYCDEVFLKINGKRHYLWRAVDQHGNILDILVQSRRNKAAAKKFFRKILKGCHYVPRILVTDKLASYGAAKREVLKSVEHRQSRYLTTEPRIRINQLGNANASCSVSSQPGMRNAFSLPSVRFVNTFVRVAIDHLCCLPTMYHRWCQ